MGVIHLSPYALGIANPEDKRAYLSKLESLKITHCPYIAPTTVWITGEDVIKNMPDILDINVASHLLNRKSHMTEKEQNALKSIQSKDPELRPHSGSFALWKLNGNVTIMKCLVTTS